MKRLAVVVCTVLMACGSALAQSSGNFSATGTPAECVIGAGGQFTGGTGVQIFSSDISTSNGSGVTLLVRPSLVTGLFTRTKIDTTVSTASADVGIRVCVEVDGSPTGVFPTSCVTYDQRFQQISSNLFSQLTACTLAPNGVACTTDADCAASGTGFICQNPTGGLNAGICAGPNPLCDFELILSTLSAHSFDFVIPVSKAKPHTVTATWSVIGSGVVGNSSVLSCVGPGMVTVTQTKVFNNSGAILSF
jgi:hypothetical protein